MIKRNLLKVLIFLILISSATVSCTVCTSVCKPSKVASPVFHSLPEEPKQQQARVIETPKKEPSEPATKAEALPPVQEFSTKVPGANPEPGQASQRLEGEVKRLATLAGGTVGVSALHIESGETFSFNGGMRFPMASVYKIPIAVQLLRRVDRGEIRLDSIVTLHSRDIHPGSGKLIKTFKKKEASFTVRELLELMLLISDNSASDAVLKLAGGPAAVTSAMRDLGIKDIEVSRSTLKMLADWRGIVELPAPEAFHIEKYNRLRDSVSADTLERAQSRFYSDARDTATPDAMTSLLAMIYDGTALKLETTAVILKVMERCQTGKSRIKGLIPPGMAVANKTGTIGPGMVNDAAIVTLPGDGGHVALSIFIKNSSSSVSHQEQIMAQMARYLYDYYFFQGTDLFGETARGSCSVQDPTCSR